MSVSCWMARRLRIQYEGALYHVINRGNYRRDIFETVGAAQAFLAVLDEATSRYGWRLHAYVLMRNHYHLALETPQTNLGSGQGVRSHKSYFLKAARNCLQLQGPRGRSSVHAER